MPVLPYRTALLPQVAARHGRARLWLCTLMLAAVAGLGHAQAEDASVVAAANAYAQAQQAELKGDHDRAAELFELADRIAPTPEALRSATRARMAAGQLALAADDAELLLARDPDPDATSRALADEVLAKARPELARYTFQCGEPCTVVVDRSATMVTPEKTQIVYLSPGSHDIELGFADDAAQRVKLNASAGVARTLRVARPALPPAQLAHEGAPREARARKGLSPAYFWSAAAATAVAGGLTLWSGLDLVNARDDFKKDPTRSRFDDGQNKDTRTNALIGVTSVLAVSTITLGFFTRFKRDEARPTASVGFDGRSAQLNLHGSF
jgi:tetratricopeptide (TPR) repeat protein